MRQTNKQKYAVPVTEVYDSYSQPLMINIGSGNTTPEESDANTSFFEDEQNGSHPSFYGWD